MDTEQIKLIMGCGSTFLVFLSFLIFLIYFLNEGASDSHVYLSIIAFHLLWIIGILWYAVLSAYYMNIVCFFVGMLLSVIGMCMIYVDYGCHNTLHEWFGVFTVVFSVVSWLGGTICYFAKGIDMANMVFGGCSILTMILASITLCIGMIMDGGYSDWAYFFVLLFHVIIIILYTGAGVGHMVMSVFL